MASEQSTTQQTTFSHESERSTIGPQLEYATARAKVLFGCYRRGDANDPDQYVASIAAVLTLYAPELVREVTDPRTGISTDEKFATFMPNSGELKVYCDAIRDRRARYDRLGALPRPTPRLPPPINRQHGRRANVLVRKELPLYAKFVTVDPATGTASVSKPGADPADWRWDDEGRGIWVALDWVENREAMLREWKAPTDFAPSEALRRMLQPEELDEPMESEYYT